MPAKAIGPAPSVRRSTRQACAPPIQSVLVRSTSRLVETLFASVAASLKGFAAGRRWMGADGGQSAFSLVLHTWSQDLRQHLHLHAVMACGVLDADGQWQVPVRRPDFLFPVRALSRVFRAKFMAALRQRAQDRAAPPDNNLSAAGRKALVRHDWVVYAKAPLGGPAQVLEYLSRYSHRTAIGNERIQSANTNEVVFTVRAKDRGEHHGGKRRVRLPIDEFIRRLLLHVLPRGVKRIRHYGVLANGCKKTQLARARQALHQPAPQAQACESAEAFMARVAHIKLHTCPQCHGPLHVAATLGGQRHLPAPGHEAQAWSQPRAPP